MGQPTTLKDVVSYTEYIGIRSERRELKHLSTCRKRNQVRDSPSSGERKGNSLNREDFGLCGVAGLQYEIVKG